MGFCPSKLSSYILLYTSFSCSVWEDWWTELGKSLHDKSRWIPDQAYINVLAQWTSTFHLWCIVPQLLHVVLKESYILSLYSWVVVAVLLQIMLLLNYFWKKCQFTLMTLSWIVFLYANWSFASSHVTKAIMAQLISARPNTTVGLIHRENNIF